MHRTRYEGRTWTSLHALTWTVAQLVMVLDAHTVQVAGGKARTPQWREFPWTASKDKTQRTLGQRGRLTDEQAKRFLDSLRPASQQ